MDAIILAGGKSSRMEDPLPKILVKVRGKELISYQIEYLSDKAEKIIISLGFQAEKIEAFVKEKYPDRDIEFAIEKEPLGTGGGIKLAMNKVSSGKVLVLNCDDITDMDIKELEKKEENTVCVAHPRLPFGLVKEEMGYAVFEEKPVLKNEWVSMGWYVFIKDEIYPLLPDKGSIEYETFPKTKLRIHYHEGFWNTLNSKKDISDFENMDLPEVIQKLIK